MKKIIENIENSREEMTSLLIDWANVNSGSENLEGLNLMLERLKQAFATLNGEMKEIELPPRKRVNSHGKITETPLGKSLIIKKHPNAQKKVFLAGHFDIALAPHHPFSGCKRLDANTLQGPGTADMKGGLVILLKALETLENSTLAGKIGWTVLLNSDEEISSPGSTPLFSQLAKGHQFGMIFEPALLDGMVVSSRKGSVNYSAVARGKAAHAGRDFFLGKNALTAIARFALAADSLTNQEKDTTVNIGKIEGGGPVNIVPELGICRLNLRSNSAEDMEAVQKSLEKLAHDMDIELFKEGEKPVKHFDEKTKTLFQRVHEHAKHFGFDLNWRHGGGVCDGNTLAAAGLPTIDTLGVVGGNLHTMEEYALLDSLTERAKWAASLLFEEAGWKK